MFSDAKTVVAKILIEFFCFSEFHVLAGNWNFSLFFLVSDIKMAALNSTYTVETPETMDPTKTLVISKNRARPHLPEAKVVNNENSHLVNGDHERHHARRSTVTVNESSTASEVAKLINEVTDSNPEDLVVAIQRKMAAFLSKKEAVWKDDIDQAVRRSSALYEVKLSQLKAQQGSAKTPMAVSPGGSNSPDYSALEQVIQERDQYREQAILSMKTVSELIEQQQKFMEKEKQYHEFVANFKKEQQEAVEIILQLQERFRSLQTEAEEKINEANEEIEKVHKQHSEDTVALRYKHRQQESYIKSLEGQLEILKSEKKELVEMCEDLIARQDRTKENVGIAADQ
uniref:Transforming acidic coiled-coil-containing protein C-terminal domain-containing protein n=1 Tax=Panagrolaimus sp. JU765 TaxID=591449 RepID=A0AC34RAY8_9BILA